MSTPARSLTIKNLSPMLPERGKIKIGGKGASRPTQNGGEFQLPVKYDHFVVTTMQRGQDNNFIPDAEIMGRLGEKPKRIPVTLLYDDEALNFQTRYAAFKGRVLWCSGDGEVAQRLKGEGPDRAEIPCPCERADPAYTGKDKCKINGNLSVLINGAGAVGGVWKFRTTSYNSVVGIMSSMALMKRATGGPLAGIPLELVVAPKTAVSPTEGKAQTVYIVGLEFPGDMTELRKVGYHVALERATHSHRIGHIEEQARLALAAPTDGQIFPGEDPAEVAAEFYPNGNGAGHASTVEATPAASEPARPAAPTSKLDSLEAAFDLPPIAETPAPEPARSFEIAIERDEKGAITPLAWRHWAAGLSDAIGKAETIDDVTGLARDNEGQLGELAKLNARPAELLRKQMATRQATLAPSPTLSGRGIPNQQFKLPDTEPDGIDWFAGKLLDAIRRATAAEIAQAVLDHNADDLAEVERHEPGTVEKIRSAARDRVAALTNGRLI